VHADEKSRQANSGDDELCGLVFSIVYSIHGIYSHVSDLALLALRNLEIVGVLGEGQSTGTVFLGSPQD
jgi:hypothetical protein